MRLTQRNFLTLLLIGTTFVPPLFSESTPPANLQVTATTSPTSDGHEYNYKVKNVGDKALMRIQIFTPADQARGQMPVVKKCWTPKGWTGSASTNPQDFIVVWVSAGKDLPPGKELSGFGFTTDAEPGVITITASDVTMAMSEGQTTGPSVKPAGGAKTTTSISVDCQTRN
jgi:hypothetical protein